MKLWYYYRVDPDDGRFILVVPDFPQVHDWGDSPEEVQARAPESIAAGIEGAMKARVQVPLPSLHAGPDHLIARIPTLVAMKVMIWNALLTHGMSKSALARTMGVHVNQVDRLVDVNHNSGVEQLDRAASELDLAWDVDLSYPVWTGSRGNVLSSTGQVVWTDQGFPMSSGVGARDLFGAWISALIDGDPDFHDYLREIVTRREASVGSESRVPAMRESRYEYPSAREPQPGA